jgi:hypothetical protein
MFYIIISVYVKRGGAGGETHNSLILLITYAACL